jgi:hypothetical protein
MLTQINPEHDIVPAGEYARFFSEQKPPRGYFVFLAYRKTLRDSTGNELLIASRQERLHNIRTFPSMEDSVRDMVARGSVAFTVTFAVGQVAFLVFGHTFSGRVSANVDHRGFVHCIWPAQPDLTWPPPRSIDEVGGLMALHHGVNQPPEPAA